MLFGGCWSCLKWAYVQLDMLIQLKMYWVLDASPANNWPKLSLFNWKICYGLFEKPIKIHQYQLDLFTNCCHPPTTTFIVMVCACVERMNGWMCGGYMQRQIHSYKSSNRFFPMPASILRLPVLDKKLNPIELRPATGKRLSFHESCISTFKWKLISWPNGKLKILWSAFRSRFHSTFLIEHSRPFGMHISRKVIVAGLPHECVAARLRRASNKKSS